MPISESILPEFDNEIAITRKLLLVIPEASASWKPHAKSWSLGDLSLHLANMLTWAVLALERTELDPNPPGSAPYTPPHFETKEKLLKVFDDNASRARAAIAAATDADFTVLWTLKSNGKALLTLPRLSVIRSFVMNHMIHHRGQLSLYLRLLDVPLPSIYGPTADTKR